MWLAQEYYCLFHEKIKYFLSYIFITWSVRDELVNEILKWSFDDKQEIDKFMAALLSYITGTGLCLE